MWAVFRALDRGWTVETIHDLTKMDPWFLQQFHDIVELRKMAGLGEFREMSADLLRTLKRSGFADADIAGVFGIDEELVRQRRIEEGLVPAFKRIDTCAAEFESFTPYMYGTYEQVDESEPTPKKKVVILGSGPNRIGQGIEFDYCCVHAVFGFREEGFETVMVNCNPETVSTDYDTADRLYFEPLTFEDVMAVIEREREAGGEVSCVVQFGGQTPLKLALPLLDAGVTILGTSPDSIDLAEDRTSLLAVAVGPWRAPTVQRDRGLEGRSARSRRANRVSGRREAVLRPWRPGHGDCLRLRRARSLHDGRRGCLPRSAGAHRSIPRGCVRVRRGCGGGRRRCRGHRRHHGAHRGGGHPLRRQFVRGAAIHGGRASSRDDSRVHASHCPRAEGRRADEHSVRHQGRHRLRARSESALVANGSVHLEGDRCADGEGRRARGGGDERSPSSGSSRISTRPGVFVKSPVFPFVRFPGVDTILGPEMKSTGEVMGGSDNFGAAFGKAMMGAAQKLPEKGCVFISVNNSDKPTVLPIARDLAALGFTLAATRGTAAFLRAHGLEVDVMYKVNEGRPNVADHLVNRTIDMVINTPLGRDSFFDDRAVRRAATMAQVPCITTLTGASAAVSAIKALRQQALSVRSLQDYYAGVQAKA